MPHAVPGWQTTACASIHGLIRMLITHCACCLGTPVYFCARTVCCAGNDLEPAWFISHSVCQAVDSFEA